MNEKDYALRAEAENGGPELSEEEVGDLLVLLRSAYPAPPPGLKDAVMEKIRAEKTGEEPQESTGKILPTADSRKKAMRRAIVRWGALAACVLLVGAVGYKLMPSMTKDMAVADTAMPAAVEEEAFELTEEYYADMDADDAVEEKEAPPSYAAKSATAGGTGDVAEEPPADAEGGYRADLNDAAPAEMPAPEAAVSAALPMPASEPEAEREMPVPAAEESADEAYDDAANWITESLYAADTAYPEAEEAAEVLSAAETFADAEADEESFDEGSLVMKLYTLNGIRYEEREIPVMGSAAMNAAPVLASGNAEGGEAPALTWYYVRTACPHAAAFRNSYHDIPNVLIAKVGPALFAAWATKVQSEDLCGVNILSFAVRFGLTAEDLLDTGDAWYFLDLPDGIPLTEENAEAVEQYYLDGGDPAKMIPRLVAYELKIAVIREAGLDAYLAWRGGDTALRGWTASEGALALGISDARLAELFEEALGSVRGEYGEEYLPTAAEAYEM